MTKVRIQFKRTKELRFLAHKDMMRMFERALRRTGLPVAYSKGFNPHTIMSFCDAMSVGMTSDKEYADFGFEYEDMDEFQIQQVKKKLSQSTPNGIKIIDVQKLPKQAKTLAKLIDYSDYDVTCYGLHVSDIDGLKEQLKEFEEKEEHLVPKLNKKGVTVYENIIPFFESISVEKDGKNVVFHIRVLPREDSGSLTNPERIVKAFLKSINYYDQSLSILTNRSDLQLKEENN